MNPIHEIAYLVLGGALSCWTYSPAENPCPDAAHIKVPVYEKPDRNSKPKFEITRESFSSFATAEVGYEESGFAIFKAASPEWFQVRKKSGESYWIHLPTLEGMFESASPKTPESKPSPSWRIEAIEHILGDGMPHVPEASLAHLRDEDLKTPLVLNKEMRAKIHQRQLQSILERRKLALPNSYVEVSVPCTTQRVTGGTTSQCAPYPKIRAYSQPDPSSESLMISMTWANWAGKSVTFGPGKKMVDHLYVFEQRGEWLQIQVAFGPLENRTKWVNTRDVSRFQIQKIPEAEQVGALLHILESSGRMTDAQALKELSPTPGFSTTGRTRWFGGSLWVEIAIQDLPQCTTQGSPQTILKGWFPYKLRGNPEPIVGWHSRGC